MEYPINNKFMQEEALSADHAKDLVVMANRILANEGVFDAFGHISVRNPENPDTFWISRAISPAAVTKDDLIEMDFEARMVSGNPNYTPFAECVIHAAIYKVRPDVSSVCHPHPPEVIPFTCTDIQLKGIYHQFCSFYDGIPVFTDLPPECGMLVNTMELGSNLAQVLGNKRGVLIRNHGVVVVGESVPRAVFSSVTLRDNAKMLLSTLALGVQPTYIGLEESKKSTYSHLCGQGLKRSWDYWATRAKNNFKDVANIGV